VAALAFDNARTRSELERLARTDDLTGLLNRRAFMSQLEHELAIASRYGSPLALLLLDLDNFKAINDSHGYSTGDRALELVAETLSRCVRTPDTVARLGGDEFAVLLPHTLHVEARALADRLRVAIARFRSYSRSGRRSGRALSARTCSSSGRRLGWCLGAIRPAGAEPPVS
jgi:diguanylate cyclase (GGDEF)-like protein